MKGSNVLGLAAGLLAGSVEADAVELKKRDLEQPIVFVCDQIDACETQLPVGIGKLIRQYRHELRQMEKCERGKVEKHKDFPIHGTVLSGEHTSLVIYIPENDGSVWAEDRSQEWSTEVATEVLGRHVVNFPEGNLMTELPVFVLTLHHHEATWGEFNLIVETGDKEYAFPFTYQIEAPKLVHTKD